MDPLVWAALLVLLGLLLVMLEIFIPSGGVLGFLALCSMLAGVALAFYQNGAVVGSIFVLVVAVALPMVVALAFHWLPNTPVGRRLLPDVPDSETVRPDNDQRRRLRELVGRSGRARSAMLPGGAVEIDGRIVDAVSEGLPIDAGQLVCVVEVRGTRVVVRPLDESQRPPIERADDLLSRPIESLGLDPFDED
jgi:membrane-bound ClpP family serine protease